VRDQFLSSCRRTFRGQSYTTSITKGAPMPRLRKILSRRSLLSAMGWPTISSSRMTGTWSVESIDVDGMYFNGTGSANSFNVRFYADDDGLPGTLVEERLAMPYTLNGSTFSVTITPPVHLDSGGGAIAPSRAGTVLSGKTQALASQARWPGYLRRCPFPRVTPIRCIGLTAS
jgi:hypothetical protein